MDNQMNNQMGILLSSGIFFLFALVFLVTAEINKRITEKNKKTISRESTRRSIRNC